MIPFDSKLKKLEILRRRAKAKHDAALEVLHKAEYEARREDEILEQEIWARCEELGYCFACKLPKSECVCVWIAYSKTG
jgi:predicted Zn-ribbon and HTH transcriptional regulator